MKQHNAKQNKKAVCKSEEGCEFYTTEKCRLMLVKTFSEKELPSRQYQKNDDLLIIYFKRKKR